MSSEHKLRLHPWGQAPFEVNRKKPDRTANKMSIWSFCSPTFSPSLTRFYDPRIHYKKSVGIGLLSISQELTTRKLTVEGCTTGISVAEVSGHVPCGNSHNSATSLNITPSAERAETVFMNYLIQNTFYRLSWRISYPRSLKVSTGIPLLSKAEFKIVRLML